MTEKSDVQPWIRSSIVQAFVGIAVWMAFGLLLEGLIGYKTPLYLQDQVRRELFRLAHAHGTLLSLLLLGVALATDRLNLTLPKLAQMSIRVGVVILPVGFLAAGVWHYESDPGIAIWVVPIAALLVIFGVIAVTLSALRR